MDVGADDVGSTYTIGSIREFIGIEIISVLFAILGDKSLGSPPIATFTRTVFFLARAAITRPYGRIQYALRVTRVTNEPPVIGTDFRLDIIDVVKSFEQNVKTVIEQQNPLVKEAYEKAVLAELGKRVEEAFK